MKNYQGERIRKIEKNNFVRLRFVHTTRELFSESTRMAGWWETKYEYPIGGLWAVIFYGERGFLLNTIPVKQKMNTKKFML